MSRMHSPCPPGSRACLRHAGAALVFIAALQAGSAGATALQIKGRLLPSACSITLAGGGIVRFGDIPAHHLSATHYTALPDKEVVLAVDCAAPTRFGLQFTDGHPAVAGMPKNAATLTLAGTSTLTAGYIEARLVDGIADNQSVDLYRTGPDTGEPPYQVWFDDPARLMRWRPEQLTAGRATVRLSAYLPPTTQEVIDHEAGLEGRLSVELVYL